MLEVPLSLPPPPPFLVIPFPVGQDKVRPLWRHYFQHTNGIIFVLDALDLSRLHIAQQEIKNLFLLEEFDEVPLLIFANKQDLPGAMTPKEIEDKLSLKRLGEGGQGQGEGRRGEYRVVGCGAVTGEGMEEGMVWLGRKLQELQGKKSRLL
jgi:signal recognition particle receptor subunit beta